MFLYSLLVGLDVQGLLLFIFAFLLITDFLKNKNPKNFPPGPWGLPFIGNVFNIDTKQPHIYLTKLADAYGNVFCIRLGKDKAVFVMGHKMVKEALVNQGENFVDRPSSPIMDRIYSGSGKSFDPHFILNNAVSNIICSMVFGHRFEYSDNHFQKLLKLLSESTYLAGTIWAKLYKAFPAAMKLVPGPHNKIFSNYKELIAFVKKELEKHKENWDPSAPQDYIDSYLEEIVNKEAILSVFNERNLVLCTLDLFLAGTETTSTTLRWALLYMMKYLEIQEKVQAEIDGTAVFAILTSVLFDKSEWQTPDSFNPEHFLDSQGNFVRREAFMPFSAGKRVCLGEQLARMELFLFFSRFLQKFSFSSPPGIEPSLDGQIGGTRSPFPYKICVNPRCPSITTENICLQTFLCLEEPV
ncbi:CP2J6 protein, partial [Amia calva]|nr:CP2J6 protein [Amia calva]